MSILSYIEKLKFDRGTAIVLIKALAHEGTPFYAYISMNQEQYKDAKKIFENKEKFDLLKLGKLIHTEMLPEPPEFVKNYIAEEYGLENK